MLTQKVLDSRPKLGGQNALVDNTFFRPSLQDLLHERDTPTSPPAKALIFFQLQARPFLSTAFLLLLLLPLLPMPSPLLYLSHLFAPKPPWLSHCLVTMRKLMLSPLQGL